MIDFGWLGHIAFTWQFLLAVLSIVLIDLVLAGGNAVVIAMAVRNLPAKQRLWGIALGAGAAVVVRRDDDHRPVGLWSAQSAQVGRVCGDGLLCRLRLRA